MKARVKSYVSFPAGWLAATAIALLTVAYRLLALRNLPNDHYMHLLWADELLSGHLPGRDFVDPGMPLTYALSAAVQAVWPTPFADAVLWTALLALATGCVAFVTVQLTTSTLAGGLAGLVAIALEPRLYSVPKLLVPAVGLVLVQRYGASPGRGWLVMLSIWTALSGLLRHDLGAFMALGVLASLVAVHAGERQVLRAVGAYAGWLLVAVLPYAAYVQLTEGIPTHIRMGTELSAVESSQVLRGLPDFSWVGKQAADWTRADDAAALYATARVLPLVGLPILLWYRRVAPRATTATMACALVMLAAYGGFILRHPIEARVPDAAALIAVVLGWLYLPHGHDWLSPASRLGGGALLVAALVAAGHMTNVRERVDDAQLLRGPERMRARLVSAHEDGTVWPWRKFWPQGEMPPVIEYVNRCTRPTDRVLITWFAPDYQYFARRPLAGGLGVFYPGRAFMSQIDQERVLTRLARSRVPIVLVNKGRDSIDGYPAIAAYLQRRYRTVGEFKDYDDSVVSILEDTNLTASSTYGPDKWPCGFED
jgi:hypothetical protein